MFQVWNQRNSVDKTRFPPKWGWLCLISHRCYFPPVMLLGSIAMFWASISANPNEFPVSSCVFMWFEAAERDWCLTIASRCPEKMDQQHSAQQGHMISGEGGVTTAVKLLMNHNCFAERTVMMNMSVPSISLTFRWPIGFLPSLKLSMSQDSALALIPKVHQRAWWYYAILFVISSRTLSWRCR